MRNCFWQQRKKNGELFGWLERVKNEKDKNHSKSPHRFKRLDEFISVAIKGWGWVTSRVDIISHYSSILELAKTINLTYTPHVASPLETFFFPSQPHIWRAISTCSLEKKPTVLICHIRLSSYCLKHIFIQIFFHVICCRSSSFSLTRDACRSTFTNTHKSLI